MNSRLNFGYALFSIEKINLDWNFSIWDALGMSGVHSRLRSDDLEIRHRQAAHYLGLTRHALIRLHPVRAIPHDMRDAEWPLLAQVVHELRPGASSRYVLIDTEFHNHPPSLEPEAVRQCKLIPGRMPRSMILSILGLTPYCRQIGRCLFWLNHRLVSEEDQTMLLLEHGDYIRIALPPPAVCQDLSTRMIALLYHHEFPPSEHAHLATHLPDHVEMEDQMPTGEGFINSLLFDDDLSAFVQMKSKLNPSTPAGIFEHRLFNDPAAAVRQQCAVAEQRAQEFRDWHGMIGRTLLPLGLQDLHRLLTRGHHQAVEEEEAIITWYLNHRTTWRCNLGRPVALPRDLPSWEETIRAAWRDDIDDAMPLQYHLVTPQPYDLEHGIKAHVLVVQPEEFDVAALLISSYDTGVFGGQARRFAVLHQGQITLSELVDHSDRDGVGHMPGVQCTAWLGWDELITHVAWPIRDGNGFTVCIERPEDPDHSNSDSRADDGVSLLQTRRVTLSLEDLLTQEPLQDELASTPVHGIVWLFQADNSWGLPPYIEIELPHRAQAVQDELHCWGYDVRAFPFGDHDQYFCATTQWIDREQRKHYVFAHTDTLDPQGTFVHTTDHIMTEFEIMQVLYQFGYWRAAIRSTSTWAPCLIHVVFTDVQGDLENKPTPLRLQTPWPAPQQTGVIGRATDRLLQLPSTSGTCKLALKRSVSDVVQLLRSAGDVLQTDVSTLDLPSHTLEAIARCQPLEFFDRYVIYTDGSSSGSRHQVPDRADDPNSAVDAWSFVVLGEKYADDDAGPKLTFLGWTAQSILYQEDKTHYVGSTRIGSDVAEREAMIWALMWRLGIDDLRPTVVRPDSITTGRQANGEFGTSQPDLSFRCLRGAYQALSALLPGGALVIDHTRGHSDEPWNDLVDVAAKAEVKRSMYLPRQQLDMREWHDDLPHLWTYLDQGPDLPRLHELGLDARAPDLPEAPVDRTTPPNRARHSTVTLCLSLATGNVNSLYTAPDGHSGKVAYLRSQMHSLHLNLLGMQETRTPASSTSSEGILRLSSGSDRSLYGIELWVNLHQPIAYLQKKPIYLNAAQIVVVVAEPQMMLTHFVTDQVSFWVLVAHAPHTGRSTQDREDWWKALEDQITTYRDGSPLFCLFDANATAGHTDDISVFDLPDEPNNNTDLFREFLKQQDLCLPATSSSVHEGLQSTWTSPDGLCSKRLDHIAIPCTSMPWCRHSCVLEDLDMGMLYDHRATALDLQWTQHFIATCPTGNRSTAREYDRQAVGQLPSTSWTTHEIAPWPTDIGTHVHRFTEQLHRQMRQHCCRGQPGGKKPFMTEALWALRGDKLLAKRNIGLLHRAHSRGLLHACLFAWSTGRCRSEDDLDCHRHRTDCLLLKWHSALYVRAHCLRQGLRTARREHVAACLQGISPQASASEILASIKHHAGPINPNKRKQKALPMVREIDGTLCTTPAEALHRWISFFAAMEGGLELTEEDFFRYWRANLGRFAQSDFDISLPELPSLLDLEAACRRVSKGKATGPDGLPGELLHGHPVHMARLLYPQLLKLTLHGQEALEHKVGFLTMAWKKKGDQSLCSSYRSLLVSSHAGKCIHRALRLHQSDLYECFLQNQQLGGRRRVPVTLCMHTARSFLRRCCRQHMSAGMIFLDLQEAFYRVVRPLVTDTITEDETLAKMAHRLQMTPEALHDLYELLKDSNAAEQAGLSTVQRRYLAALHTDTGFRLRGQTTSCRTEIGSRPGDCFADIVFGYAWARLLRTFEQELSRLGLLEEIDVLHHWNPFRAEDGQSTIPFMGPTWMDDLCVCLSAETATALESKVCTAIATQWVPIWTKESQKSFFHSEGKGPRPWSSNTLVARATANFVLWERPGLMPSMLSVSIYTWATWSIIVVKVAWKCGADWRLVSKVSPNIADSFTTTRSCPFRDDTKSSTLWLWPRSSMVRTHGQWPSTRSWSDFIPVWSDCIEGSWDFHMMLTSRTRTLLPVVLFSLPSSYFVDSDYVIWRHCTIVRTLFPGAFYEMIKLGWSWYRMTCGGCISSFVPQVLLEIRQMTMHPGYPCWNITPGIGSVLYAGLANTPLISAGSPSESVTSTTRLLAFCSHMALWISIWSAPPTRTMSSTMDACNVRFVAAPLQERGCTCAAGMDKLQSTEIGLTALNAQNVARSSTRMVVFHNICAPLNVAKMHCAAEWTHVPRPLVWDQLSTPSRSVSTMVLKSYSGEQEPCRSLIQHAPIRTSTRSFMGFLGSVYWIRLAKKLRPVSGRPSARLPFPGPDWLRPYKPLLPISTILMRNYVVSRADKYRIWWAVLLARILGQYSKLLNLCVCARGPWRTMRVGLKFFVRVLRLGRFGHGMNPFRDPLPRKESSCTSSQDAGDLATCSISWRSSTRKGCSCMWFPLILSLMRSWEICLDLRLAIFGWVQWQKDGSQPCWPDLHATPGPKLVRIRWKAWDTNPDWSDLQRSFGAWSAWACGSFGMLPWAICCWDFRCSQCFSSACAEARASWNTRPNPRMKSCRAYGDWHWCTCFCSCRAFAASLWCKDCLAHRARNPRTCSCWIYQIWSMISINGDWSLNPRRLRLLAGRRKVSLLRLDSRSTRRVFVGDLPSPSGKWWNPCLCLRTLRTHSISPS